MEKTVGARRVRWGGAARLEHFKKEQMTLVP